MREIITFECSLCGNRNYTSTKNKKRLKTKLELNKYCKFCKRHTKHKEIK